VTVHYVKPGSFITTGGLFERRPFKRAFTAVAHDAATVALWSHQSLMDVIATLEPMRVLRLAGFSWRSFSVLLRQKLLMLSMSVRERVLFQLELLAKDFGHRIHAPPGTLIDLDISHHDLARLVAADRTNVTRCLRDLRDQQLIAVHRGRFVLRGVAMERDHSA
jgi:CRP-like cAMP-binding protein